MSDNGVLTMDKVHVRKPIRRNGQFVVVIAEGISPLAKEIKAIPCGPNASRESAFQAYRQIKKEVHNWL